MKRQTNYLLSCYPPNKELHMKENYMEYVGDCGED